jgi:hypothetical protein
MISTPSYLSCTHSFLSLAHLATQLCYTQNYSLAPTLLFPFTAEPPYPLGRPCSAHAACRSLLLSHPTVMAMLPHPGACSPVCLSIPYNTHLEGQGHGCWKVAHPYSPHSLCRSAPLLTLPSRLPTTSILVPTHLFQEVPPLPLAAMRLHSLLLQQLFGNQACRLALSRSFTLASARARRHSGS